MHRLLLIAGLLATLDTQAADTRVLPSADVAQAVRTDVARRLDAVGSTATFEITGRIPDQSVGTGDVRIVVGEIVGRFPRARVGLPVSITSDGRAQRTLTVWLAMQDRRHVPTYAGSYPAGTARDQLGVVNADVDMTCCAGSLAGTADDGGASLRLRRPVRAGQPLMAADFEAMPDVAARAPVVIEVERGALRIRQAGIALTDGRIGERIAVRTATGAQAMQARVIDGQRVQIDE